MSKHNSRKAENMKCRSRIQCEQESLSPPERQKQKKQNGSERGTLSLLTFNRPPVKAELKPLSEASTTEEQVFELLYRTTRSKDEFISSLLTQNSELQHHIRFLEGLTAHFMRSSPGPDRNPSIPALAAVQPVPPAAGASDRVRELEEKLHSITREWEQEKGRFQVEIAFRDTEIERLKGALPGCPDGDRVLKDLEEKLKKEQEAKMKVVQEFIELSSQIGDKEEKLNREVNTMKKALEEKSSRVAMLERHLDDIKAARRDLKHDFERLERHLAMEKAKSWWRKLLESYRIIPQKKDLAEAPRI